jgi:hypothetical protein
MDEKVAGVTHATSKGMQILIWSTRTMVIARL